MPRVVLLPSLLLFLFSTVAGAQNRNTAPLPTTSGQQWVSVFDKVHGAIVIIETQSGFGTGFLVQKNGTLVTNYHVIKDAQQIAVRLETGETYRSAYLLRTDEEKDIAILRIEGADLPFISLANSDAVKVGEEVMAIGTPEGLEQTASPGFVSGRRMMPLGYQLIQTTAPISHGSSGGPLLNRAGQSIGIMTAFLAEGQNLNFAVPINYVRGILDSLALSPNSTPRLISGKVATTENIASPSSPNSVGRPAVPTAPKPEAAPVSPPPSVSTPMVLGDPTYLGVIHDQSSRAPSVSSTPTPKPEPAPGPKPETNVDTGAEAKTAKPPSEGFLNCVDRIEEYIWAKPDGSGFVAKLDCDERITVLEILGSWTRVRTQNGKEGYLLTKLVGPTRSNRADRTTVPAPTPEPIAPTRNAELVVPKLPATASTTASAVPTADHPDRTANVPATIWLYRTKSFNQSLLNPTIYSRGRALAKLEKGQFFALSVPAGTYYFSFKAGSEARVTVSPGQRAFFKVIIGQFPTALTTIKPVASGEALKDFKNLRAIEPQNIRSSDVSTKSPLN